MKKIISKKKFIILVILVILILILSGVLAFSLSKKIAKANLNNIEWLRKHTVINLDKSFGDDIYAVSKNKNISIYNLKYQKVINEKIADILKTNKKDYVVIYNPYGTNELSINVYFKSNDIKDINYTISSDDKNIKDFSKKLAVQEDKSAYQLIGLTPQSKNKISIDMTTESTSKKFEFTVDLSKVETIGEEKLKVENGSSEEELSNGLFAMLGNDSDSDDYLALYDNDGLIRSETPIIGYRAHAILFDEDKMLFSISQTRIVEINNLGEVTNIYRTGKYQLHHDYTFDEDKNLLVLANNTEKETEEDCIIKIDRESKKSNGAY